MFEKLPTPFGLVRFGVSPLHPAVKNVIHKFTETASSRNFKFFGNVTVGSKNADLSLKTLRSYYNAVVLAYGSEKDKYLNIPGEELENVFSSKGI